jgi:hypothetical protein
LNPGDRRKPHTGELDSLYFSPNIKSNGRGTRRAVYAALMGNMKNIYKNFKLENLYERDHLRDSGVHGKITLNWILKK